MKEQCQEVRFLFDRLLDGDLRDHDVSKVEKHLEECPACQAALKAERDMLSNFELLPELECPESVIRKIEAAIPEQETRHSPFESLKLAFRPFHRRLILVGTAAAAIIIFMFVPPSTEERGPVEYSQKDAQRARKTAKWSLVYAAQTISTTEKGIVMGMLVEHIPTTVRNAIQNKTLQF